MDKIKKDKAVRRTSIGGQAVLEGVMMKGARSVATAVRASSGEITVESKRIKSTKERNILFRLPFVRGVVNLCSQLGMGMKILLRSAEVYGDFAEPTKFEKWFSDKFKISALDVIMVMSVFFGLAFAVALFVLLPNYLTGLLFSVPALASVHPALQSLTEGAFLLIVFIAYVLVISAMKDIRRVFMYHGAEHRTINCYEHGLELTVENVQKQSTQHSRCGTTFMFLVIVVSIVMFAFVNWGLDALGWLRPSDQAAAGIINALIKVPCKLVFIPVVAGVSYELLKLLAKSDCLLFRILRAPGMWLQKLTTRKPDDSMAEVAIKAFETVQAMDEDLTIPETEFVIHVPYAQAREKLFEISPDTEESDADWLFVDILKVPRSTLPSVGNLTFEQYKKVIEFAEKLKTGEPLQYVLGNTEFYGIKFAVSSAVLIPRPETEILVENALKTCGKRVLDLCTGSGAIAVTVAKNKVDCSVTASDISAAALEVAKSNAVMNAVKIKFVQANCLDWDIDEKFDTIISNPPYIPSADIEQLDCNVKDFEPRLALDGGKDGLDFYRKIEKSLDKALAEDGTLLVEFGIGQTDGLKEIFAAYDVEIKKDLNGIDRIARIKRK